MCLYSEVHCKCRLAAALSEGEILQAGIDTVRGHVAA